MSPTATLPKTITATFSGATTNDPVIVTNTTTNERVSKHPRGELLRIEGKNKGIIFDCQNFVGGWSVGDVVSISIGGTKAATVFITLTAATEEPQTSSETATAVSTGTITF